jgi:hypothetical protein
MAALRQMPAQGESGMESPVVERKSASASEAGHEAQLPPASREVGRRLRFRPRVEGGAGLVLLWLVYNLGAGTFSALTASNPTADDANTDLSQVLVPLIALPAVVLMIWRSSILSAVLLVVLMVGDAGLYVATGSGALAIGHLVLAGLIAQSIPVLLASRRAKAVRSEPATEVKTYADWYDWSLGQISSAPEVAHAAAFAAVEAQRTGMDPVAAAHQVQPGRAITPMDADRRQLAEWVSWARRQPSIRPGDAYAAAVTAVAQLREGASVVAAAAAARRPTRLATWKKVNLGLVIAACFFAFIVPAAQSGYIVVNGNFPLSTAAISLLLMGLAWTAAVLGAVLSANRIPLLAWAFPPMLFIGGFVLLTVSCLDCTWSHR